MSVSRVKELIRQAGRQRVLLRFWYEDEWRVVEPYSFRDRSGHELFYAWCHLRDDIRSFDPEKMERVEVTHTSYSPRYEVEF
jgi:predicted DNA-binding transcriptional regulator YafY